MKPFLPVAFVVMCAPAWAQNPSPVRVVDADGKPIPGALVQLRVWSRTGEEPDDIAPKATDASGVALFSLAKVPDGKAVLGNVVAGAKGFSFGAARVVDGTEVRLERGASWRGKVVDEKGKPLANATVTLRGSMKNRDYANMIILQGKAIPALYSAKTGADGTFSMDNAPTDREFSFSATRSGFARVQGQDARAGTDELIKMSPGGSVRGRALDATGKPIAKTEIYAGNSGMSGNSATTDAQGVFTIDGLAPGTYRLSAYLKGNAPFIMPRLENVRVEAGKETVAGAWRGIKGFEIRGFVRDAVTKKPIAGASFGAMSPKDAAQNNDSAWSTSDATGHFVLRVASAGKYAVRSSGAPFGWMRSNAPQNVQAGAVAPPELAFALQPSPVVRGVTVDEKGQPMAARLTLGHMFGSSIPTDATGKWEFRPQSNEDLTFGGGDDDNGYYEVVSPHKVDFPPSGPIFITMRRKAWQTLEGRVVTPEGAPVVGAKIEAEFTVMTSDSGGYGARVSATSGEDGRFKLERLRDSRRPNVGNTEVRVTAKKAGFQFVSGGKLSREGDLPRVSDFVFAALAGKVEGTTQPNALVVVAGRETRADAKGHFAFDALPAGKNTVFVALDGLGGSAQTTGAPLEIKLQKPQLQGQDEALAKQIWAELQAEPNAREAGELGDKLAPPTFENAMKAAQATGNEDKIAEAAQSWKSGDSTEILLAGLEAIKSPDRRAEGFLVAALAANDAQLSKRALEVAETIFKGPTTNILWREPQLYRAAVLRERLNGEEDGRLALGRALAYTLQNHPEKSRTEDAMQTQVGRNEAFCHAASIVAHGSDSMLREVLDSMDEGSGLAVRALGEVVPVVARAHGIAAALPLLDELKAMPAPTSDLEPHYLMIDPDYAFGQAVQGLLPTLGAQNPAKALELAKQVEGDEQRARALASAAKFQTPEIAAPLWKEAVAKIGTEDAPRIAALVWQTDPKLAMELFQIAQSKAEEEMKSEFRGRNSWIPFAFYFARADPAMSRLILEREWAKGVEAKIDGDELAAIAISMSPVDGARADEMARSIGAEGFGWNTAARRKIARFLVADDATRSGFTLNRIGSREAWDAGDVQW